MTDAVPSMQPVARLRGRTPATSRQKSPISTVNIFPFFTFNRVFLVGEKRIFVLCRLSCRFCFFGFDFFWFDPKNSRCWYWSCDSGFQFTILSSYWKFKRNNRIDKNIFPLQFHVSIWVPLSSTQTPSVQHIGSTQRPHLFSTPNSSVPHQEPLCSTSPLFPHEQLLCSTPKTPQFHTKNPSIQHTSQFHTKNPQFNTKNPSVPHQKLLSSTHRSVPHQKPPSLTHTSAIFCLRDVLNWGVLVWNWGMCWTEGF